MADSAYLDNNLNKLTFPSEKFPETQISSNFFNFPNYSNPTQFEDMNDASKVSKRSKISSKLSRSQIEFNNDIEITRIKHINSASTIVPSILLPNEIIVNIVIKNSNDNIILKKVILPVDEGILTHQVIAESVDLFNKLFEYERMFIRLSKSDMNLYSLKPSKKNGLPNYDFPSKIKLNKKCNTLDVNKETKIEETKIQQFSLLYINGAIIQFQNADDFNTNSKSLNDKANENQTTPNKKPGLKCRDCLVF